MFVFQRRWQDVFLFSTGNLHKGFDRLTAIVQNELAIDLVPELYFLFCNRKQDRVKVLYLDGEKFSYLV